MDTVIGYFSLQQTQKENAAYLTRPEPFKGFAFWGDGKVVGVSESDPTQEQIDAATAWLNALPADPCQQLKVSRFSFKLLWGSVWANPSFSDTAQIEMVPYRQMIEDMWNIYDDKAGIYPYAQKLVAANKMTAGDLQIVVDAFAAQGIDITTIQ